VAIRGAALRRSIIPPPPLVPSLDAFPDSDDRSTSDE
jgi:hypothetical protein